MPPFDRPHLVQEFVPGPGEDLKVYVVDRRALAVRKPFGAGSFARPGRPAAVSDRVRGIALSCGRALGLDLFGADIVEGPEGPVVVDVNYFPGYKGPCGVAGPITRYLLEIIEGRPPPSLPVPARSGPGRAPVGAG
ncbi:MAG: ATP-grasp domain-containing protein [Carbonactinosporaceae bacterium]